MTKRCDQCEWWTWHGDQYKTEAGNCAPPRPFWVKDLSTLSWIHETWPSNGADCQAFRRKGEESDD